jgi:processive 1,2-diacylglycerol beta-glucosyltransferase
MKRKRVLLLSEGFGAGHTQAAHALADSLRRLSPDLQTRVFELGSFFHPTLAPWIISAYRKTVTSQPKLIGIMYRSQYNKSLNRLTTLALHRLFYKQSLNMIRQLKPDVIVCTHPIPNAIVSRLKRLGLKVPLCTVITDYDAHGTWISQEVNRYLVSTEEVKRKLLARGVPPHIIQVTGIPVHPNFWTPHNKEEIRSRFGLQDMPTVLVMGGGWGLVNNIDMLEYMTRWRDHIQLIICLGNNEKVRTQLSAHPSFHHPNIHLLGFTREIDKLYGRSGQRYSDAVLRTASRTRRRKLPILYRAGVRRTDRVGRDDPALVRPAAASIPYRASPAGKAFAGRRPI